MKMRNKGKVYPSPSSSSLSSNIPPNRDALSILKLLPAAILVLISILSVDDQEVLAYMVTRSMKPANPSSSSSSIAEERKKNSKKSSIHKPPVFDCECFDCYTSYWFRWDSSSNRELIHQAIEAFEEYLSSEEQSKKNGKGKKREKMGRRGPEKPKTERESVETEQGFVVVMMENEGSPTVMPEKDEVAAANGEEKVEAPLMEEAADVAARDLSPNNKGFVRKILPDVVGFLNSRLWSLWSPNV